MVQTIESYDFFAIRFLRIHDLLHDLTIHEAMKESNLTILPKEGVQQKAKGPSRRARIQNSNLSLMEYTGPNLRSLLCFENSELQPEYSGFRLLKVLSFMNVRFSKEVKLDWLKELIHLRYLGFINCGDTPKLPDDIGHCKNLQTLQTPDFDYLFDLPESLWSIKALRHVISPIQLNTTSAPPAWAELSNLLTLGLVVTDKSCVTRLPRLTSLRTLYLANAISWDVIANLLHQLNHLISLTLNGEDFTRDILDTRKFPSYENIQCLHLVGCWSMSVPALDASMLPLHLTELVLSDSCLEQDPMLELKKLASLRVLVLDGHAYIGNQMTCSAGGFHRLRQLTITGLRELEELRIEENSMHMLSKLILWSCEKMQMLPNLQYVSTLRKLVLNQMPDHIKSRVQNEDRHKVEHVLLIEIE